MSKSGTQAQTRTKVSKKAEKTPKKELVKNDKKTSRKNHSGLFTSDRQPEKRGRSAGDKDFKTIFIQVAKENGKQIAVEELWKIYLDPKTPVSIKVQIAKILFEYLFEKPSQTIINENKEPLKIVVESEEIAKKIEKI